VSRKICLIAIFISVLLTQPREGFAYRTFSLSNTASWREEVLLHDGRKIIVQRWQKRGGMHALDQEPGIKEQTITFRLPGTKRAIKWKDEYSEDVGHANFELVALHVIGNTPYVVTIPYLCPSYNKWGRPNPPYVVFKHVGNGWMRIGLAELPAAAKSINLVVDTLSDEKKLVSRGLIPVNVVNEFNSSLKSSEYKSIIRSSIEADRCAQWYSPRFTSPKAPLPIYPNSRTIKR